MRTFRGFRFNPPRHYIEAGITNGPYEADYEGVIFKNGRCAVQWLTNTNGFELFDSFEEFMKIHGHPEYGTQIVWEKRVNEQRDMVPRTSAQNASNKAS